MSFKGRRGVTMKVGKAHLLVILVTVFLAASLTTTPALSRSYLHHKVKKGETLYRISKRYGVSVKTIMKVNRIKDPTRVRAGMVLLIPTKGTTSRKKSSSYTSRLPRSYSTSYRYYKYPKFRPRSRGEFTFPGKVIHMKSGVNQGLDLTLAGGIVRAAADGKVIYRTTSMMGYSSVLILQHQNGYETVYAGKNVGWEKENNAWVVQGEIIGVVKSGELHFELRRNGTPLPALKYLKR